MATKRSVCVRVCTRITCCIYYLLRAYNLKFNVCTHSTHNNKCVQHRVFGWDLHACTIHYITKSQSISLPLNWLPTIDLKAKKQYHNNITVIISFIIIMIIVSFGRLKILYYLQMNVCGVQIRKWTCYFLIYIHITYLFINIRVLMILLLLHRIGYNQRTATKTNSVYSSFHLEEWTRYTQHAQLRDLFISQVFYGLQLLPLEHCSRDQ